MKKKWVIIIIVIIIAGVLGMQIVKNIAYKGEKKKKKLEEAKLGKTAIPVYIAGTEVLDLNEVLTLTGDVHGRSEVDVFAKVPGKLAKKVKKEESYVKKDETIALVDRDEDGMDYAYAKVKAPISGTLTRYYTDIGGSVAPTMPLLNIADMDEVKVIVNIIEKDIPKIKHGQKAMIYVDAYPGRPFTGRVDTINQALDRMTRTAEVRIVMSNKKHLLKPGMFARVNIIVDERIGVLAVPVEAIMGVTGRRYLFTVVGNKAVKNDVTVGVDDGKMIEIIEGLKENDVVVTAGQSKLNNDREVKVVEKKK